MVREVKDRKLLQLITYYDDLKIYKKESFEEYHPHRYSVERLIQLFIDTSVDLLAHILKESKRISVKTYALTFITAGNENIISAGLANNLSEIAKIRNELVHLYGNVDPKQIYNKFDFFLQNFSDFIIRLNPHAPAAHHQA
ncbi:DUF86 domain-containing protein [bacterium]|nr:DUF86 domain-containing protein [bacterium]